MFATKRCKGGQRVFLSITSAVERACLHARVCCVCVDLLRKKPLLCPLKYKIEFVDGTLDGGPLLIGQVRA